MRRRIGLVLAALFLIAIARVPADARERVHYIAAVEVTWNYAPLGMNAVSGKPLRPLAPAQIGWTYRKAVYREFTDGSFTTLAPIAPSERYRGLVGPTIYAEAGDTVVVHFKNLTTIPMDIAAGGVPSIPAARAVAAGGTRTYRWPVGIADGPGPRDESSVVYTYASNVRQSGDELAGLIGPLIVTRQGAARADGSPADVDREVVTLFSVQIETLSPFIGSSLSDPKLNSRHIKKSSATFFVDNAIHSINGYVYGNMPMLTLRAGERVRWYLLSTQGNLDGHSPTWSGETVLSLGNRGDVVALPGPHAIADMVPDNIGIWQLTCSINAHLANGLEARYQVVR
ncbi:MAG TPA: multicopper oxidase domain-containing protein [Candidatus Eremiobacteraceae bacterium]|nr:multicopper oxidase domain-containing protein [Candidatus Eremiobacteraceae bacterium]